MFSQSLEEQYILEYFGIDDPLSPINNKSGTFLDIGANDGKTFSNTLALLQAGFKGVCVEPSPTAFAKLKENHKDFQSVYHYNFALGNTNGIVKMWDSGTHLGKEDHGLLSTLNQADYNKWKGATEYKEIEVQCFRWKTFLNRLTIKSFDFISIDAEGNDIDILQQIELRETSCVCVEFNGDANLKERFDKLMIGFRLIYTSSENLLYAR